MKYWCTRFQVTKLWFFLLLFFCCIPTICALSFEQVLAYAQKTEEGVQDPHDWVNPEFFTPKTGTRFWHLLSSALNLPGTALVSRADFMALLNESVRIVEEQKKADRIVVKDGESCIVFGPLFGAFHSLVRCLQDLKERAIIDGNMHVADGFRVVFLGDVFGRAPLSIETLALVLTLLVLNPERVFYCAGSQETDGAWKNFNTKQQLIDLHWYDMCADRMDNFFSVLPNSWPFVLDGEQDKQVLISYDGITDLEVCEPLHQSTKIVCPPKRDTLVVVQADQPLVQMHEVKSLLAYGYEYGALMWNAFSSPTRVHQVYRKYYYDAYCQLQFGSSLGSSALSCHLRHIGRDTSFAVQGPYNLVSGALGDDVVRDEKMYSFGSSLAFTGGAEVHGTYIQEGILSRLEGVNHAGGVQGYFLRPFLYNDNYNPLFARRSVHYLYTHYGIDIFVGSLGSATLNSYLDWVSDRKIAVLFPSTGSPLFRNPQVKGAVFLRASYQEEFERLLDYVLKKYKSKRFAFFYQNDSFGRPPVQLALKKLAALGITDVLALAYGRVQVDFSVQAEKLIAFKPDAIGLIAAAKPAMEFLRQVGAYNLIDKNIFVGSTLTEDTFRRFMTNLGIAYSVAHFVPNPTTSQSQLAQEYRKAMDENGLPYDDFTFEGYLAMELFVHALESIKKPFTKDAVLDVIESWKQVVYKGITLQFNPENRQLLDYLSIETVYPA